MAPAAWQAGVPAALVQASADALPFASASFDLVISTVSFHHWNSQRAGIAEAGGCFVLADLHAVGYLRAFYALARRRDRMHTRREITQCWPQPVTCR